MLVLAAIILFSLAMAIFVGFLSTVAMFISCKIVKKKYGFSKQLTGKNFVLNLSGQVKKSSHDFFKKRYNNKTYVQIDFTPK